MRIEEALHDWLPVSSASGTERFNEALRYAVFPGGKRLRAYLTLIASVLGGASDEQALTLACAVEYIHASSLILDDLPCMDDADLRRNRPTLHIAFGESMAVLVAVALLNQAYALFARSAPPDAPAERLQQLMSEVTGCIGSTGMIAGQAAELELSGVPAGVRSNDSVLSSRELKTTALMRLMMVAGGIIAGAEESDIAALATFGERLGRAYQIYDDLADTLGDRQSTGKSVGQDSRHLRPTLVRPPLVNGSGANGSGSAHVSTLARGIVESGQEALLRFGNRPEANLLRAAADYIVAGFTSVDSFPKAAV